MHQERDPTTVSQLLTRMQDSQHKVNSLSSARDFHDPETGSTSGATHVPSQPLTFPSPRTMPSRDSGLPHDTRTTVGTSGNVFESLLARKGPPSDLFGIFFLRIWTRYYRKHYGTWKRGETRAAEFVNTNPTFKSRYWNIEPFESYWWNLFSQWYDRLPEISYVGDASWKISGLWNFKSWKVNFRTEVCLRTARSSDHNALDQRSWDSKVNWRAHDVAIDFGTNRIPKLRYAWCEDCVCNEKASRQACALPKNSKSRRATRSKVRPNLTRKATCLQIYEHFRATGAYEAVQGLSALFNLRLQNDDVQDFDVRCDQALLSASETPTEMILEGLCKSKLQDSVELQTVLALYDQETVRNNGHPSFSRLDQMMRTRNFRVRSEIVERGSVSKSQNGKKAFVERKVGECFQWKSQGTMFERRLMLFQPWPRICSSIW